MIPTIGNENAKNNLDISIKNNRIPHANLFIHPDGVGALGFAINYISEIFKKDNNNKNIDKTINNILNLNHPDIHFIFPTAGEKSNSANLFQEWRKFILNNPFASLIDWYNYINVENQQGKIGTDEANYIKEIINLHSFEGSYKVFVIWHSEKLNEEASNKILKILEEENNKTLFILLTNDEENILPTIYSRTQKIKFNILDNKTIIEYLIKNKNIERNLAINIAEKCNGNMSYALKELNSDFNDFEIFFTEWIRNTFKIKNDHQNIQNIFTDSEKFKKLGRENQKEMLIYFSNIFRDAFLYNINVKENFYPIKDFNFQNFSKFINNNNIEKIHTEIENTIKMIERNISSDMAFSKLSINIARFIHQK